LLTSFVAMPPDERWLSRPAETMLSTFPWFAGERFDRILADLARLPAAPTTLAEGFRLLPRLVQPLMERPWHGVWLATTSEHRREVVESRSAEEQFWRRTSDPETALERLLERDSLFAEQVVREAESLGLAVVVVDGTRSVDDVANEIAELLRYPRALGELRTTSHLQRRRGRGSERLGTVARLPSWVRARLAWTG
jgi:hypothetical protein